VILLLVLFLLHADPTKCDNVNETRWARLLQLRNEGTSQNQLLQVPKDVIFTLMQKGVSSFNIDDDNSGEVQRWTRELLERSCSKMEKYHPNISSFKNMTNDFLEILEKIVKEYEVSVFFIIIIRYLEGVIVHYTHNMF